MKELFISFRSNSHWKYSSLGLIDECDFAESLQRKAQILYQFPIFGSNILRYKSEMGSLEFGNRDFAYCFSAIDIFSLPFTDYEN